MVSFKTQGFKGAFELDMAMAQILSQNHKRTSSLYHLFRCFSRQARSSKGAETAKKRKSGVLSIADRCKNILGLNWRGQLTTLRPRLVDKEEQQKAEKTLGELSNYIVVDKRLVVYVPEDSQHCPNLLLNNRASLIVGHTDPSPLMGVFRQVQKTPPHTVLVGTLMIPEDDDILSAEFIKAAIKKEISELQQAVNQSSTSIRAILESGGHVLRTRVQALNSMLDPKKDDTFYRFDSSSCHHIDILGNKHLVDLEAPKKDPSFLSPLLPIVMEGINRNHTRRMGLKVLCAWLLRVKVEDAFMFSADKWGLNVLAKVVLDLSDVPTNSKNGGKKLNAMATHEWKDLRLTFKQEVDDLNEFFAMLGRMEKESVTALSRAKASITDSAEEEILEA